MANENTLGSEPDQGPRSTLRRALGWLDDNIEYWLNFLFYSFLTSIIVIEVFRRYVLNSSTTYGEEVARYAFIWLAYIATARGVKNRSHLSIENIRSLMGRTGKFALFMFSDFCFFTLSVIIVITSIKMVMSGIHFDQRFTGSDLPIWIATVAVPIAWTLIGFRVIQRALVAIGNFRNGRAIELTTTVPTE
jgi:TRAP-type C4-dicarboxylate transport system permease small subunit